MRVILKNLLLYLFKFIGLHRYFRNRQNNAVVVLTYHSIVPEIPDGHRRFEYRNCVSAHRFEQQIRFMLRHYKPVSVEDMVSKNHETYQRGFLITFDDGFKNNLKYAAPILHKYGLEGCFFISTGLVGKNEMIWTERITFLLFGTNKKEITVHLDEAVTFRMNGMRHREHASWEIRNFLKTSSKEKIDAVLDQLEKQINDVVEISPQQKEDRYAFMDWNDVRKMLDLKQVVGSHTHNHEVLSTLTEEQSRKELRESQRLLSEHTGQKCRYFSYPNGATGDFTEKHKMQLRDAGFVCAFSQIHGKNDPDTDLFELRRINISEGMSPVVFEAAVCGLLERLKGAI